MLRNVFFPASLSILKVALNDICVVHGCKYCLFCGREKDIKLNASVQASSI